MAKGGKKKGADKDSGRAKDEPDKKLAAGLEQFTRGDYIRARALLAANAEDPSLADGARREAADRVSATRVDRATLYVGLACVALFALVVLVTSLLLPHGG